MRLVAAPGSVVDVRREIRRWSDHHAADLHQQADIALAVSEAVTNVVMHAYPNDAEDWFVLTARATDRELVVVIRDYGVGLDSVSPHAGLGVGLTVIDRLADSVTYADARPGTLATLRFRLPGAGR